MEQTTQANDENQPRPVKLEIKQESADISDYANENHPCTIKQEETPDFWQENDPYSIKQESIDLPDFVDTGDYSDTPIENKPKKQYGFHQCPTCGTKYWKLSYLEIHQAIHDPRGVCPVCSKPITGDLPYDKRLYKQHINQHIRTKMKEDKERECTCSYCQKKFSTRRKLKLHVRVHTGERPYKCNVCSEQFKLLGAMRDHEFTHAGSKEFVCDKCEGRFTTSSSLSRHRKRKHREKQHFDCKQCDSKFSNVGLLKAHQKKVHTVNNAVNFKKKSQNGEIFVKNQCHKQTYECILCGDLLSNIVVYSEHRRLHLKYTKEEYEDKKSEQYPCKFCSKSFTALQNVFRHLHVHMAKTDKCQLCNDYYTKYGLKRHMIRCHKNSQCKICLKFVLGKHKLYRHYQKYHSKVIKKFSCKLCNRQYMTKNALYMHHSIVHVQNIYVQCNFCVAKFVFSEDLAMHITSSHMKDNKEMLVVPKNYWTVVNSPIRCPKCTKTSTVNSYKSHNKSCKNRIKVECTKLKCKFCHRILLNSISYRKHTKMHSNFVFQCKYCDKFYDKSGDLKKHRKNHYIHGKMYWCNLCNCYFKKIHELMRHKMGHFMKKRNNS